MHSDAVPATTAFPAAAVQPNSRLTAEGEALGGSYVFDRGFAGVSVSRFASLYHIPGEESAESNSRIDLEQFKVNAKGELRLDGSVFEAVRYWAGASDYKHDERGFEDGADSVLSSYRNKEQEGRVEVQTRALPIGFATLQSAGGVQFGHQNLSAGGEAGELLAPNETKSIAAYLFNELRVSELTRFQVAGRVERTNVEGTAALFPADLLGNSGDPVEFGVNRDFVPISASVGVLHQLPLDIVGSLTAQRVERAPKTAELFSKGPHHASETFEIGNPDLNKEVASSVEAGLRRKDGRWRFDATAYYTKFNGFIYKRLTGITCDHEFASCGVDDHLRQVVFSQRDATFTGTEIASQLDVVPVASGWFGLDGQYDAVRARLDDGSVVPRIPPQRIGGGVFWRDAFWFARLGVLHAFAVTSLAEEETPTPAWNNLRAELRYRQILRPNSNPFGVKEVSFGVIGDNLLDAEIRNHVSFKKDEVLLPGRNVRFVAGAKF